MSYINRDEAISAAKHAWAKGLEPSQYIELIPSTPLFGLNWLKPSEPKERYNKLFLAFQPGYPLRVVDWKTGSGYCDIRTDEATNPTMVAYINLPKEG